MRVPLQPMLSSLDHLCIITSWALTLGRSLSLYGCVPRKISAWLAGIDAGAVEDCKDTVSLRHIWVKTILLDLRKGYGITACGHRVAHRKWKETKQQPSLLPGSAVPDCSLVYFHYLWANILSAGCTVVCGYSDTLGDWQKCHSNRLSVSKDFSCKEVLFREQKIVTVADCHSYL